MAQKKTEHLNTLKTKIGILGLGAIGSLMAYHLRFKNSNELFYFSRTEKNNLKLKVDETTEKTPIYVETRPNSLHTLDWLIICLKEYHYPNAISWFSHLITPKTSVVVIRNGLYLKKPLLDFTNSENILECIIDCPTQINNEGFYNCLRTPILTIPNDNLSVTFKNLFSSNLQIKQREDFKTESWKKLIESSVLGAIMCLYNDTSRVLTNEAIQSEYKNLMNESIDVAKADGAKIDSNFTESMLEKVKTYTPNKSSSMLSDMRQGQPIELGAKNGIIATIGKQYNIPTPLNNNVIQQLS